MRGNDIIQPAHALRLQKRQNPVGSHLRHAGASSVHQDRRACRRAQKKRLPLSHIQHGKLKSARKPDKQQKIQKQQAPRAAKPFPFQLRFRTLFCFLRLLFTADGSFSYLLFSVFSYLEPPQKKGCQAEIIEEQLPVCRPSAMYHRTRKP